MTQAASVARSQRVSTVFSRGQSLVLRPVISLSKEDELYGSMEKETRSPCCKKLQSCCFNFMHCRFKHRDLKIGDRPLYRDDVFYESNLQSLPNYNTVRPRFLQLKFANPADLTFLFRQDDPISFHLSVTRVAAERDVYQHITQQCCVCHDAILRTCATMIGLELMRSKTFVFLCLSSIFFTLGIFIPYVFVKGKSFSRL